MEKQEISEIKQDVKDIKESVDFVVQNAATKEDLKQFATKEDIRRTKDELREDMVDYKSDIINHVDAVLKKVETIREEQIMKTGRDDRQDEDIKNVKKRVTTVEHRIGIEPIAA